MCTLRISESNNTSIFRPGVQEIPFKLSPSRVMSRKLSVMISSLDTIAGRVTSPTISPKEARGFYISALRLPMPSHSVIAQARTFGTRASIHCCKTYLDRLHEKFEGSSMLPDPLYKAIFG